MVGGIAACNSGDTAHHSKLTFTELAKIVHESGGQE